MVHNDTFKGFFFTPISLIEYYEIINIIINQKTKNQKPILGSATYGVTTLSLYCLFDLINLFHFNLVLIQ